MFGGEQLHHLCLCLFLVWVQLFVAIDTIVNQELLADVYVAMAQGLYDKASSGYTVARNMAENLLGKNCKQVQRIQEKRKNTIEQHYPI